MNVIYDLSSKVGRISFWTIDLWIWGHYTRGSRDVGWRQSPGRLYFVLWCVVVDLSYTLCSVRPSCAWNFEVTTGFLENMCTTAPSRLEMPFNEPRCDGARYHGWMWVDWILRRKYETLTTELSTEFGKLGYLYVKAWEFPHLNYKNRFYWLIHSETSSTILWVQVCSSQLAFTSLNFKSWVD
jgi:hypothetical protein